MNEFVTIKIINHLYFIFQSIPLKLSVYAQNIYFLLVHKQFVTKQIRFGSHILIVGVNHHINDFKVI